MKKLLFPILALALAVGLALPMAALTTAVNGADPVILYGTARDVAGQLWGDGDIYQIDPISGTSTRIVDISACSGPKPSPIGSSSPNGNAFDVANQRFYFASFQDPGSPPGSIPPSELYFVDLDDAPSTIVHAGTVDGHASDGAFYDGKYWYVGHGTEALQEVSLNADGTIASETTAATNIAGDFATYLGFGDIEFDCDGLLFLSATIRDTGNNVTGFLFGTYNMDTSTFNELDEYAYQIAFGSNGTLYGHNAGTGDFHTIDTGTGALSWISTGDMFTDLAGTLACEAGPAEIEVDKDYRYTDVCFEKDNDGDGQFNEDPVDFVDNDLDGLIDEDDVDCPLGTYLGDELPTDAQGNYKLEAVIKKNGKVSSYNPGQYYAVSTVTVLEDVETLTIVENWGACDAISALNPPKGGGSVVIVQVGPGDGVAYQILDAKSANVTIADSIATAVLHEVLADTTILMYVKFGPALKGEVWAGTSVPCLNTNTATVDDTDYQAVANLVVVEKD